ncbi:MAG: hypothetical protein SangKO_064270 [Sandaracinaceae bacterium]
MAHARRQAACYPEGMLRRRAVPVAFALITGCLGLVPAPDEPLSLGVTNDGVLHEGRSLPDRGEGYVRARPGEATRFGTPRLVSALEGAAAAVAGAFPGSAPVRIGDLSFPGGGRHHRHGSHRTGRDADVLFYVTDPSGRSREGRGWLAYNRFGYAVDRREGGAPELFLFDDARNWHFVRTLLLEEDWAVQWIFVSRGVKARLLRWAETHEPDPRAIARAAFVLHQPADASPHDDHFHVRVLCTERERAQGCRNRGPHWEWLRGSLEKGDAALTPLDDDALIEALMAD